MKIGLEKEFFVLRENKPIVVPPQLSADESGVLAEARGNAFSNVTEAIFSLQASAYDLSKRAEKMKVSLVDHPLMVIPRSVRLEANRIYAKGLTRHENLYGHKSHRNLISEQTAGVHVSFTKTREEKIADRTFRSNEIFDFPQIFRKLDEAFAVEIKQAKRRPGFYELKPDGRIEYRSLPANVDMDKLIDVLVSALPLFND